MKPYNSSIFVFIFYLVTSFHSEAAGFRCKTGQHIKVGQTTEQVLHLCGKPDQKFSRVPEHIKQALTSYKRAKVWLYLPGKNKLQQYLVIRNKTVSQIIRGDRI